MTASRFAIAVVLFSFPLFGQYDLTGEWGARYHEDQAERIPGPELGDYLGLPITDAARLRGATAGRWTTDMFVEAVYKSLGEKGTH